MPLPRETALHMASVVSIPAYLYRSLFFFHSYYHNMSDLGECYYILYSRQLKSAVSIAYFQHNSIIPLSSSEFPAAAASLGEIPSQLHSTFTPLALSAFAATICKQFPSIKYRILSIFKERRLKISSASCKHHDLCLGRNSVAF